MRQLNCLCGWRLVPPVGDKTVKCGKCGRVWFRSSWAGNRLVCNDPDDEALSEEQEANQ